MHPSRLRPVLALVLPLLAAPLVARAQACHGDVLDPSEASKFTASATMLAGRFDRAQGRGDYEGLSLALKVHAGGARYGVVVPSYRIDRNGTSTVGLGDIALRADLPIVSLAERTIELGVGLGATLPSGRAQDELGMGHVMAMPWLFGALRLGVVSAEVEVGSAHALADHVHTYTPGGDHVHVSRPVVDPMNANEVWGSAALAVRLGFLQAVPTIRGARPLGDGEERLNAGLGLRLPIGPASIAAGGELPLVGNAFTWRGYLRGVLTF